MKKIIQLHDGSRLEARLTGAPSGKVIMLPGFKKPVYGSEAESLKAWGVDPEAGNRWLEGLSDTFQVLYFDYEEHLFRHPRPDQLTPENITKDLLRIADEMNVQLFSYYGYSWLALTGLQLALATNRLESLIMGGFPPYEGPYREMKTVTSKTYEQTLQSQSNTQVLQQAHTSPEDIDWDQIQVNLSHGQTKQFLTLYNSLTDFDDRAIQDQLTLPKLAFAGEQDIIVYGDNFGGVTVDIISLLRKNKDKLTQWQWDVEILIGPDMNHTKAMQPAVVLPLIKPWLIAHLL